LSYHGGPKKFGARRGAAACHPRISYCIYSINRSPPSPLPVTTDPTQDTTLASSARTPRPRPTKFESIMNLLLEFQANQMTVTAAQLYQALPALKASWNGDVEFKEVTDTDHFYTDGISKGAIVKIVLRYPDSAERINVIFVFPDGGYSQVFERPVNHMISAWMAGILKKKD